MDKIIPEFGIKSSGFSPYDGLGRMGLGDFLGRNDQDLSRQLSSLHQITSDLGGKI